MHTPAVAQILSVLPHSQCQQCGYAGCQPFATALASGEAAVEGCQPGGALVREQLKRIIGAPLRPPTLAEVLAPLPSSSTARIIDADCIGCAKCLDACPVDAILGAPRQLHTVVAALCTGCALCLPPCPVDCIEMLAVEPHANSPQLTTPAARRILDTVSEPCSACGACNAACPVELEPQHLLAGILALDLASAGAAGLAQCAACSACEQVCPSNIPLTAYFAQGQAILGEQAEAQGVATAARVRATHKRARPARAEGSATTHALTDLDGLTVPQTTAAIAAAVHRAQSRRALDH